MERLPLRQVLGTSRYEPVPASPSGDEEQRSAFPLDTQGLGQRGFSTW